MIKRINLIILAVLLLFTAFINVLLGGVGSVYAAENKYSNVLDDLRKDETFDFNDYPNVDDDYSLQVIQIAESTDGELFLYVYQPAAHSKQLTATAVNMALSESVDGTALFNLTLLNREGVLQKYRVDGVKVSSDEVRYYNITSIYRDWIKGIDDESSNDNTVNSVSVAVGKLFTANSVDGTITYDGVDIVLIENPYVDYLRYTDSLSWCWGTYGKFGFTDLHYIAFDTDLQIDNLKQCKVSFNTQSYDYRVGFSTKYGEVMPHTPIIIDGVEKIVDNGSGFLNVTYEWDRIQRTEDFVKVDGLGNETILEVQKHEWVVMFYETPVEEKILSGGRVHDYGTKVSDVKILRLDFDMNGKPYSLGAVSSGVTGDDKPGNPDLGGFNFWQWLANLWGIPEWAAELIVYGIGALLILSPVLIILSSIFPIVGTVLKAIFKGIGLVFKSFFIGLWYIVKYLALGIWYVVSLPFRGIIAVVRKIRGD